MGRCASLESINRLTIWMANDLGDDGIAPRSNLAVEAFEDVQGRGSKLPSPTFVPETVIPKLLSRKGRNGICCIPYKASSGVGIQREHERDEEVVCVPEGLVGLLADTMMRRGIHHHHAEQHDMAGNATCSGEVVLHGQFRADMILFDVVETGLVSIGAYCSFYQATYLT